MSKNPQWTRIKESAKPFLNNHNLMCKHQFLEECGKCILREVRREFYLKDRFLQIKPINGGFLCGICSLTISGTQESRILAHIQTKRHKDNETVFLHNEQPPKEQSFSNKETTFNENSKPFPNENFRENSTVFPISSTDKLTEILEKLNFLLEKSDKSNFDDNGLDTMNSSNDPKLNLDDSFKKFKVDSWQLTRMINKYRQMFGHSSLQDENEFKKIFEWLDHHSLPFNRGACEDYIKEKKWWATTKNKWRKKFNCFFLKPNSLPICKIDPNAQGKPRFVVPKGDSIKILNYFKENNRNLWIIFQIFQEVAPRISEIVVLEKSHLHHFKSFWLTIPKVKPKKGMLQ